MPQTSSVSPKRILFAVMPYEGEVRDRVTAKFYKNSAVKYMPLGVLSIAACIGSEHEVEVLDAASLGLTLDETIARIDAYAPDILGLSVVTYRAWAMVEILRRTSAPIKIVGGPHAKYNHDTILRQGAHAVFVDDAERTLPKWLEDGCPPGAFFGGSVDLNSIPLPARDLVDLADYRIKRNGDMLFDVGPLRLPMYSSNGCPFACIYCDVQQKDFNFKAPDRCVDEFLALLDLGATSIHILDDAFNVRKERVSGICRELVEQGVATDWSARGTVEIRESVIADLAAAGCKRLHVGIESLDDDVLISLKKGTRYKHIRTFCELCNKYGITILAYFIIGAPGETAVYRDALSGMIEDLGICLPYFNLLTPLAETPYYNDLLAAGHFPRDHWADYCADQVRDFEIPDVRETAEADELRAVIDGYVEHFRRHDMPVFVS